MELLQNFPIPFTDTELNAELAVIHQKALTLHTSEYLKLAFNLIDLTTLNSTDQTSKGVQMAQKVNRFHEAFPNVPNVAAICVYPPLVKGVVKTLTNKAIGIASVGAGFPSSQTYLDVKVLECQNAVADGATDIDIVISLGTFFDGNYKEVYNEISAIKSAIGNAHLKVILETGALKTIKNIWEASLVSMAAGADFIKTSTGKMEPAATPEAAYIMCRAIKAFHEKTGKKVAFKPAGGMVVSADALEYIAIVEQVLGKEWLNNRMLRLGASRLANNLLTDLNKLELGNGETVSYF